MAFIARMIGNIVIVTFLVGAVIILAEMIWYRLPGRGRRRIPKEEKKKRVAIITGATSGLGREYAFLADVRLTQIDEIWLVARRADKLQETAGRLRHVAKCLSYDLTRTSSVMELIRLIQRKDIRVRYLINCAGFARMGTSKSITISDQADMMALNCMAAVRLTDACLPYMKRGDRIVNVCSTAAFQPMQRMNVYAASKAFMLRYTRALRLELLPERIAVTAVCPYWIKDTEFIEKAENADGTAVRSYPLASRVSSVAAVSLIGIRMGLPVITPGIVCTVHRIFSGLLPDTVLQYIWEGLRRI